MEAITMLITTLIFVFGLFFTQGLPHGDEQPNDGTGAQQINTEWKTCLESCIKTSKINLEARALPCTHCLSHFNIPSGEVIDPFLNLLEKTYGTSRDEADYKEAGTPLLLSTYIKENKMKEAREAAYVDPANLLPGIESYAGYLTVNKEYNSNLWFWYFPVQGKKVEDTPWIIWLQGGPGAPSTYGLFTEIGPLTVTEKGHLEEMKHSWGKNHSLLFIDNPVGTGYSFTDDDRGYSTNQTTIGENLYNAVQQFLTIFPELRNAPLTIAGESYAGKHIPSLGIQILWHRDEDEHINLQGLAIGNGYSDPVTLQRYSYFLREIGLISDNAADDMMDLEAKVVEKINDNEMKEAFIYQMTLISVIHWESDVPNIYNYLADKVELDGPFTHYIQTESMRKALHVGNTDFTMGGIVYLKLRNDFLNSAKMWIEELLENYRVMFYNGHLDVMVPYHCSVNTYKSFNFSAADDFKNGSRYKWDHDNELAGYYRVAGNLTEVMVRGAGHMVPSDQPVAALGLISAFARGLSLDGDN